MCRVFNDSSEDNSETDEACTNQNTCQEAQVLLRVQSSFRPLWPALLVLAEAAVLAIIILLSERDSNPREDGTETELPGAIHFGGRHTFDLNVIQSYFWAKSHTKCHTF